MASMHARAPAFLVGGGLKSMRCAGLRAKRSACLRWIASKHFDFACNAYVSGQHGPTAFDPRIIRLGIARRMLQQVPTRSIPPAQASSVPCCWTALCCAAESLLGRLSPAPAAAVWQASRNFPTRQHAAQAAPAAAKLGAALALTWRRGSSAAGAAWCGAPLRWGSVPWASGLGSLQCILQSVRRFDLVPDTSVSPGLHTLWQAGACEGALDAKGNCHMLALPEGASRQPGGCGAP